MPSHDFCTSPNNSRRTKVQMSALFLRGMALKCCTHRDVLTVPLLRLLRFFSPPLKMRDPLRPNGQKILKPKHLAKKRNSTKNTHTYIRKTLGRGTLNSCAKIQGLSLTNGADMGL